MAASVNNYCTICHDAGISNRAVSWCTECEVLFCDDCDKHHSMSRLSKNHKTMSSEDYRGLPASMLEMSSQCKDHKKKFELYCSLHDCPCCVQCIADEHQKCQELKPLSDILKQVKSSASVQLVENDLKDVHENLDTAITYLKTRISTINTQKTKAVDKIRVMRKSINDYLNKLEQDILNELESKCSKLNIDMANILQQMEQQASKINQMQSQFTLMTQHATELQMYIGLRDFEKTISQTAKYIADLESGDHFIEKNLEVIISSVIQSIQDVKSFGDIIINTTSSTLQIKAGRKDQAQIVISKVADNIEIKPSLLKSLTVPKDMKTLSIYACCILPDGKFVILDHDKKRLLLFNNDGIFIRKVVMFKRIPVDACFVRNNTVAVTLGFHCETRLVDIKKNKIIQTLELPHGCYGVASDGLTLVIGSYDNKCSTVNLIEMSHTFLTGMEGVRRISLFQGNIYGTNCNENKVYCYKSTGELVWRFQHHDIERGIEGITLDINGFVYIASYGNNSVVVVSPDGKNCKNILSEADGILRPTGIDINRETGIMIVSSAIRVDSSQETAFVYKI